MNLMKQVLLFFSFVLAGSNYYSQVEDRLPCVDKDFAMIVHIVNDSLGDPGIDTTDIRTYVSSMNDYFEPICVSFSVCEFRFIDDWRYNEFDVDSMWEEMQVKYHEENRINIFYVTTVQVPGPECSYTDNGYITHLDSSGIVVDKAGSCYTDPVKVLTHEMGHYFGLPDAFEGSGSELVNGGNCATDGDLFCDTPADPYSLGDDVAGYVDGSCRFINGAADANAEYYTPHVGNVMSFYPGSCMCEFSYEQLLFMANTYLSGPGMW